ncbi:MAG TPA: GatB/YqeY domain-containing protein [Acidobacteriaceae bacterium]|nr:GatB/YqeY domain-containing protein [Acidobacteriaceae bacterium]
MELARQVDHDMIAAMKAHDVERTSTLRMMKAALKNRQIEKRSDLSEAEGQQVLTTMIKQRRDSIEQFTKGNRLELAAKEAREIVLIESYMPKTASEEDLKKLVDEALAGTSFGPREMGPAMKAVQAKVQESGLRADGKLLSELVKGKLQG